MERKKNFVHLHTHSDGSLQDGIQTVEQIVSKAAELGMPAIAITDHGRAANLLKFKKACEKKRIKYIPGIELYEAPEDHRRKEKIDGHSKTAYHLTALAKNKEGLKNIFRLTSVSWREGLYYGKPRCSRELIKKHSEGLVILSGCGSSRLSVYLMEDKQKEAEEHVKFLLSIFKDDFYIELQNHGISWQPELNNKLKSIAKKFNIKTVATQDSHYINKEDAYLHSNICKLTSGDLEFDSDQNYFKTREEMEAIFDPSDWDSLDMTLEIAEKCNVDWDYSKTIWPKYTLRIGKTEEEELRILSEKGFLKKFGNNIDQKYRDRLEYELDIIIDMGFASYFLIVQDFSTWCTTQKLVSTPGRGSASSSLVCYCLGITQIDPIRYNLPFSRFLGKHRVSLPDIDFDVDKEKRADLLAYVADKYGRDKLSQIGTYSEFKPRGSLKAFTRVNKLPIHVGERLSKMVPPDISGKQFKWKDILEKQPEFLKDENKKIVELAIKAEGIKYQAGVHAAGVVISDDPIDEVVPLFIGKHGEITTQFDMKDVEEVGLVKFDFLGLKTLTVLREALELIEKRTKKQIDLNELKDYDEEAYKLFHKGKLNGIFQFETSSSFRDFCMQVKPTCLEDLAIINAVQRPGPLSCGVATTYTERRLGAKYETEIPALKEILKNTYGLIIFQEDVIRICVELAGYSEGDGDLMRRAIGKKNAEAMEKEKDKFISGCVKNNIEKQKAINLFKDIEGFAAYGFCAGHSYSYSRLSYFCAYLKAHYPHEFYTALLNNSLNKQDDIIKYINSCRENGISLSPPDINRSQEKFTLDNNTILFGLSGMKGVGKKGCEHFLKIRGEEGFKELSHLLKQGIGKTILVALAEAGALQSISSISRKTIVDNAELLIKETEKQKKWELQKEKYEENIKEREEAIKKGEKPPRRRSLKEKPEFPVFETVEKECEDKQTRLSMERRTLGFYLTGHPLDNYPNLTMKYPNNIGQIKAGKIEDGSQVLVPVVISSVTEKCSKKKENYASLLFEDQTGRTEAIIFPKTWAKIKDKIKEEEILILKIRVNVLSQDDGTNIVKTIVNEVLQPSLESDISLKEILIGMKDCNVIFYPNKETKRIPWRQAEYLIEERKREHLENLEKRRS